MTCIDLSETVHVLNAIAIVTSEHYNLSTIVVVSHILSAIKRCSLVEVKPWLQDPEKVSLSPD